MQVFNHPEGVQFTIMTCSLYGITLITQLLSYEINNWMQSIDLEMIALF